MDIVTSSIRDRTSAGEYRGGLGQPSEEEEEEDILAQEAEEAEAEATELTDPPPSSRIKMSLLLVSPRLCLPSSADGPTLPPPLLPPLSMFTDADGGTAGERGAT